MNPPRALLTRRMPSIAADLLLSAGVVVDELASDDPPPRSTLLERAAGCAALLTTLSDRVDAELLDAAGPQLRIAANFAVGYENIDLAACRARGVRASNTPGVLTEATADLTWALILAAARRIIEGDALARSGRWRGWTPTQLLGLELRGATLGVVGAGRIGSAVARRAQPFGMHVLYAHPRPNVELERDVAARRVTLVDLLAESDVVSLHAPMREENRGMIGERELGRMKPTALLINTARGPLVDEAALARALREGRIAAAGLDVYEREPVVHPLLPELPNVVLLPHLGSATHATRERMARMAAENIIATIEGREPPNAIA